MTFEVPFQGHINVQLKRLRDQTNHRVSLEPELQSSALSLIWTSPCFVSFFSCLTNLFINSAESLALILLPQHTSTTEHVCIMCVATCKHDPCVRYDIWPSASCWLLLASCWRLGSLSCSWNWNNVCSCIETFLHIPCGIGLLFSRSLKKVASVNRKNNGNLFYSSTSALLCLFLLGNSNRALK